MKTITDGKLQDITFIPTPSNYKNWRDELIKKAVEDINLLREGTKHKKETARGLAIRANRNSFLKNDGELDYVFKECARKRNYSHFYWLTK